MWGLDQGIKMMDYLGPREIFVITALLFLLSPKQWFWK